MSTNATARPEDIQWYREVPRSIRRQTIWGLALLGVTFGGFGTWAATAPLAAAVVTQGSFVATGKNKIIQHLEGGIIEEILVSEGQHVVEGEPLIQLDETAARVKDRQVFLRQARLEAVMARLGAEAEGRNNIEFPPIVLDNRYEPDVEAIMESQIGNFASSRSRLKSDVALLQRNIEAFQFRAQGYEAQRQSMIRQLAYLREEYRAKLTLFNKGLLRNSEVKSIQRAIADAEGQIGRMQSEISETGAQIEKLQQQIVQTNGAYRQAALDEVQNVEAELDTIREQSLEAQNILRRAVINAPVSGIVVRLYYHTPGGVIESGKPIMEILPSDVPLIIETQVPRTEIDAVKVGQDATVRLTALNQRTTPVLQGDVYYVSADALGEPNQVGKEVYLARVELPASELKRVAGFSPTPGMPAEIMIQTSERTFFDYLSKPIRDSMARAFLEQ
jgi:HlyD family type I secretion membrane fusion protein